MATTNVNIKGSWVKETQKLSVLLPELFCQSKIIPKFKSFKEKKKKVLLSDLLCDNSSP